MELKKYVLFNAECNNNIAKIKDLKIYDGYYTFTDELDGVGYTDNYLNIVKTSNNILDFVEVGDLIQCQYKKQSSDGKQWIETPIYYVYGITNTHFNLPVFSILKSDEHITAIYKLQPNGDYKRYEVKA